MHSDQDQVGRLFAQLTGELENACMLAAEGQNRRLPLRKRSSVAQRLRGHLSATLQTLEKIEATIARARGVRR